MAYILDYNKILTLGGYEIVTPAKLRQYLDYKSHLIITVGADKKDPEFGKEIGGNAFCYDNYGNLKWQSNSKNVTEIYIEKDGLHFYDTSSIGYDCLIDVDTGNIIKMEPTK